MQLIGLLGKKKSGKTTAAKYIAEILKPNKVLCIGFADALKEEIAQAVGQPVEYIEQHKDNFRLIMQGWGTDFKRKLVRDDYWIKKVLDKLVKVPDDVHTVVIPDVRFINEAHMILGVDGVLVRIERDTMMADFHESETEHNSINGVKYTVQNDSTLREFKLKLMDILFQISDDKNTKKQSILNNNVYPPELH